MMGEELGEGLTERARERTCLNERHQANQPWL